ncbi:MAG: rhodanese-like domain-containing protein [Planctomycetes bacterium]|nr:rhodanese-like domain-containing protein [Planctomycetota bacterium]
MTDAEKQVRIDNMYGQARAAFEGVPEISASEVISRLKAGEGLVLVDVRTPEERKVSMIDGAITAEQFEADSAKHEGATVVCYCMIGGRSGQYAQQMRGHGVNAVNMPGAVLSWSHAGGAFVDANGATKRVHTGSPQLDLLAEGYEAVW